MTEEMIESYKQLNTNEKRNELSNLLIKLDQLINQLIIEKKLDYSAFADVKNYDSVIQKPQTEDDMLLFFYDDLWKIKNKILLLLAEQSN